MNDNNQNTPIAQADQITAANNTNAQPQAAPETSQQSQATNVVTPQFNAQTGATLTNAQQHPESAAPQAAPAPQPVHLDRLSHNENFVYTDKNGYDWNYTFQFPGVRKAYEILDNAQMANGGISSAVLYDGFCQSVIVSPAHLTLDDFDERPGLTEVMNAADSFLGRWLN